MSPVLKFLVLLLFCAGVWRLSKSETIKSIFYKPEKDSTPKQPGTLISPPNAEAKAKSVFSNIRAKLAVYGGYLPRKYIVTGGNVFGGFLLKHELDQLNSYGYDLAVDKTMPDGGIVPALITYNKESYYPDGNPPAWKIINTNFGLT